MNCFDRAARIFDPPELWDQSDATSARLAKRAIKRRIARGMAESEKAWAMAVLRDLERSLYEYTFLRDHNA